MVVRRIRDHVATHNWFAVGVDFLIVVVGVFMATQADNWNETRSKLADAAESRREPTPLPPSRRSNTRTNRVAQLFWSIPIRRARSGCARRCAPDMMK